MGVTTGLGSLANIFGPLWAGAIYDHIMIGSPFWMGAIILAIAAVMLFRPSVPRPQVSLEPEVEES